MAPARGFAGLVLLAGGAVAGAQIGLPATSPTALPAAASVTAAPQTAGAAAHRAQVVYSGNQLQVTADNSSLNQILREISRQTGMKITGGVADERVFGKYGPGPLAEILENLLSGTGSNMVLVQPESKGAAELILTARLGGPTPPNPNAPGLDDDALPNNEDERPARVEEQRVVQAPPPAAGGIGAGAPAQNPLGANGNAAPATGGATPQSPNGVQTPQQIFEQLQRMQAQQPANPQ